MKFHIHPIKQSDIFGRSLDKRFWFDVTILPDRKTLIKKTGEKNALALTKSVKYAVIYDMFGNVLERKRKGKGGKERKPYISYGKIGDLIFIKTDLTDEIITHECVHAMFRTLHMFTDTIQLWSHEDHGINSEEYMCFLVGEYVNQIKAKIA